MIDIGTRRECFFDDFLVDTQKTTVKTTLHHPQRRELVFAHDEPWEMGGGTYHNFFCDNGLYRMYYLAWKADDVDDPNARVIRVCYAESSDGINWIKPKLGICEFDGSRDNNIILDDKMMKFDCFYVFRDDNPQCIAGQKYKAVGLHFEKKALCSFYSPDGIHFEFGGVITDKGAFDTLNVVFWDKENQIYRGFIRGFHISGDLEGKDDYDDKPLYLPDADRNLRVRDIRYMESKDFVNWSEPKLLDFGGKPDIPLYTNCVSQYERAPHIMIGFPTRYVERKEWSKCFDELCDKERRKKRIAIEKRLGLATTDCLFMCSRDGIHFTRYDEAFMRPGAEFCTNWRYGCCYPTIGFALAGSHVAEDADNELSMLCHETIETENGSMRYLRRYILRQDGFCSLHAGEKEEVLVTKPFVFDGDKLYANISTSAAGYMYFEIKASDGKEVKSCEMFGDSIDKLIGFEDDLTEFSGKEVVMTVRMCDADLYAIKFERS